MSKKETLFELIINSFTFINNQVINVIICELIQLKLQYKNKSIILLNVKN